MYGCKPKQHKRAHAQQARWRKHLNLKWLKIALSFPFWTSFFVLCLLTFWSESSSKEDMGIFITPRLAAGLTVWNNIDSSYSHWAKDWLPADKPGYLDNPPRKPALFFLPNMSWGWPGGTGPSPCFTILKLISGRMIGGHTNTSAGLEQRREGG